MNGRRAKDEAAGRDENSVAPSGMSHEPDLVVGGLQRFSLCDFPARVAAVVFTQGCNFRCPFCHNGQLIPQQPSRTEPGSTVALSDVFDFLRSRVGRLDGVVVSGGEPTIQPGLARFLGEVRRLGFDVKLDTNGSRPGVLAALLADKLVDYVAMDIKAPLAGYARLAGCRVSTESVLQSIELLAASGVEHEFRTTVVDALLDDADLVAIEALVPPGSVHRRQRFVAENALDPRLRRRAQPDGLAPRGNLRSALV